MLQLTALRISTFIILGLISFRLILFVFCISNNEHLKRNRINPKTRQSLSKSNIILLYIFALFVEIILLFLFI